MRAEPADISPSDPMPLLDAFIGILEALEVADDVRPLSTAGGADVVHSAR